MNVCKMIMQGPSAPFARRLRTDMGKMERNMLALCPGSGQLNNSLGRVISAGGKRLRPLLAWTAWHMAGSKMPIVPLMTMLELMHTTSLIHDDFVDGADTRRGVPTINAADGALAAISGGDYLLACAMDILELYRGTGINEALSEVSQEMCLGELEQHAALFSADNTCEEEYFRRIRRKTALLMAESCRSGAIAGGSSALAENLWEYGLHLGLAFQLRDDLTDWDTSAGTGKPPLKDLCSGVMTLPIVYTLTSGGEELKKAVEKREKTAGDIEFITYSVRKSGALKQTHEALKKECSLAARALETLPSCAERESLLLLAKTLMEVNHSG